MQELVVDSYSKRLDSYLSSVLDISRSKVSKMIKDGNVLVNGNKCKASDSVDVGDNISYEIINEEIKVEAEDIPLDIVYEDDDVIVVNKPNGMVVHPAVGNKSGTLVNALMHHSKNLSSINGEFRPGIVHRIDAYTTGLLMVAKNDKAHEFLQKQLEEINELIKVSPDYFIENGHAHLAELYKIFYQIHRRSDKTIEKAQEDKKNEISQLKLLQQKSKRMNNMYSTILKMEEIDN